jgi:hypothetical protein
VQTVEPKPSGKSCRAHRRTQRAPWAHHEIDLSAFRFPPTIRGHLEMAAISAGGGTLTRYTARSSPGGSSSPAGTGPGWGAPIDRSHTPSPAESHQEPHMTRSTRPEASPLDHRYSGPLLAPWR